MVIVLKEGLPQALVGTKAANLASLIDKGIPVPPGFCITVDAYRSFIGEKGLGQRLSYWLKGLDPSNPQRVGAFAERVQKAIKGEEFPQPLGTEVFNAFDSLRKGLGVEELAVAVRSSATAEDLLDASFAGQYDTYLNVGEGGLIASIKDCWASLWSIRGILYRERKGIDHISSAMGVLVQAMIPSEASGVVFTASPTGRDDGLIWINAGFGLGEGVVSGKINSDIYKVDRGSLRIAEVTVRRKETAYKATNGRLVEEPLPMEKAEGMVLPQDRILELASLALKVEDASSQGMGCFCDIEWAFFKGRFYILQVRPICLPPIESEAMRGRAMVIHEGPGITPPLETFTPIDVIKFPPDKAKEIIQKAGIRGITLANLPILLGLYQNRLEVREAFETFYPYLFDGGMEDVNFLKITLHLPKVWEMVKESHALKEATIKGIERVLKTGKGFGGTGLVDILRYGLPLMEGRLPWIRGEWIKDRIVKALRDGEGMEETSLREIGGAGIRLLEKASSYPWLKDVAEIGIKRILREGLRPTSFEEIKKDALPLLRDTPHHWLREGIREGVKGILERGRIKTNLVDIYTGLGLLSEPEFSEAPLRDALLKGLTIAFSKSDVYRIGEVKDERVITNYFKPMAEVIQRLGDEARDLETAFYENASVLLDKAIKGVDADDSIAALHGVLLLASEYTPHRGLEAARRVFIERVYKNLPGASLLGVDWRVLHDGFEEITEACPPELKRVAIELRDGYHNTLDRKNLEMAEGLLKGLKENHPSSVKAIELSEGIVYWLSRAYRPLVEGLEDSRRIEALWPASFRDRFPRIVEIYTDFISHYEGGSLVKAVLSYTQLRDEVGRLLLIPDFPIEERLTLYLTDINLERLEPGLSVALSEGFSDIEAPHNLMTLGHWTYLLLLSASRYLPEIEETLALAVELKERLKGGDPTEAKGLWCRIKADVGRIKEARKIPSLILFDTPAERMDTLFFTISPIAPGEAEGYIRVIERPGGERLGRVLNDPVKGIKEGEIAVLEYLPEISELKVFPSAFIVERGSVGSHTAKVAIEFGIPAVRMDEATKRFKDGERVVVKVPQTLASAEVIPVVYERVIIPPGKATPFVAGEAKGVVRVYRGEVDFLKTPCRGDIIIIPYLDTKYLDIWATEDGPGGVIVERGGELTHPMIVAREMMNRLKRRFPILRWEGVFDILREGMAIKILIPEDLEKVEVFYGSWQTMNYEL